MNKGELTRRRIIEQAAPLFNQRGLEGCSMQDVMDATGLEKGGLYRHFGSKEELAVASFQYSLDRILRARAGLPVAPYDAPDHLLHLIGQFVRIPSPIPGGCPLMNTAVDADDGNAALRALVKQGVKAWKARLTGIVEEGIREGVIVKGTSPQRIANIIIATLEGALMISRVEGNRDALHDAESTLNDLVVSIRRSGR